MKKYILIFMMGLTGCASSSNNIKPVSIISYEKYTDLYVNDELVGISHTQIQLPYKNADKTTITAKKQGCESITVNAEYEFDTPMLLNPFNVLYVPEKYFSWDWWRPAEYKTTYFVTPVCSKE